MLCEPTGTRTGTPLFHPTAASPEPSSRPASASPATVSVSAPLIPDWTLLVALHNALRGYHGGRWLGGGWLVPLPQPSATNSIPGLPPPNPPPPPCHALASPSPAASSRRHRHLPAPSEGGWPTVSDVFARPVRLSWVPDAMPCPSGFTPLTHPLPPPPHPSPQVPRHSGGTLPWPHAHRTGSKDAPGNTPPGRSGGERGKTCITGGSFDATTPRATT